MTITLTEIKERLRLCGFVHITGLSFYNTFDLNDEGESDNIRKIEAHPSQYGRWVSEDRAWFVTTIDGEVWMRIGEEPNEGLLCLAAPNGKGTKIPFSKTDSFCDYRHLGERVSDPYCDVDKIAV